MMMKPGHGAGGEEDVQVLVERPYVHSHEDDGGHMPAPTTTTTTSRPPPPPPPTTTAPSRRPQQPPPIRARPYYRRWTPWIVPGATVACIAVFLVTMYVNDCPRHSSNCAATFLGRFAFQPLKENLLLGPSSTTLVKMGALDVSKVVQGRQGWRLITCMWLHAGVLHLLINMLCLVFIGIRLEQEFGFVRIGVVYLMSGFGGSLMSALFLRSSSASVGASGALFGLVGSMLSELITNWSLYANKVAALVSLVLVILLNLALGILPWVDNFAHIGGLVSGFLLGFVVLVRPHFAWLNGYHHQQQQQHHQQQHHHRMMMTMRKKKKHKTYQYVLWVLAAAALVVGFTAALVLLLRGYNGNEHCSWCHYLSCVPTRRWRCDASPTLCTTEQRGENTLTVTCSHGGAGGKNTSFVVPNATQDRTDDICHQLCT